MNLPCLVCDELSDEAAAHVAELLHGLATAFECEHLGQILRYYNERSQRPEIECSCHEGQLDLFDADEAPF